MNDTEAARSQCPAVLSAASPRQTRAATDKGDRRRTLNQPYRLTADPLFAVVFVRLKVILLDGSAREINAVAGETVLHALLRGGVSEIQGICGGNAACATCHIYVEGEEAGSLRPIADGEDEMLSLLSFRRPASRLACAIVCDGPGTLCVTIAPKG